MIEKKYASYIKTVEFVFLSDILQIFHIIIFHIIVPKMDRERERKKERDGMQFIVHSVRYFANYAIDYIYHYNSINALKSIRKLQLLNGRHIHTRIWAMMIYDLP